MTDPTATAACDCCEINDYYAHEDYAPCENCGHSLEEHGR